MLKKFAAFIVPTMFIACSDFSADLKGDATLDYGKDANSILTCSASLDGKVVKPADGSEYRLCKDGQWFSVEIGEFDEEDIIKPTAKSSSSEVVEVKPSPESSSEAEITPSSSSRQIAVIVGDDDPIVEEKVSSSSVKVASSSSSVQAASSSSVKVAASSSSAKPASSSAIASSSSKTVASSSSSVKVTSSSSVTVASSSSIAASSSSAKPASSSTAISSSSKTVASSSSVKVASSSSVEASSSSEEISSSSKADPVETLYFCEDDETIVVDLDNCPENQESSSSEVAASSSSEDATSSSSLVKIPAIYDCSEYDCVTTAYLNQNLLVEGKYGEFLDTRDKKVYRTIKIGEQTWMAQDLAYETASGSWCYKGESSNCDIIGRAYTWDAALGSDKNSNDTIHGICPEGFHIPSDDEFQTLAQFVGGDKVSWTMEISSWGTVYGYEHAATALKSPAAWSEEGLKDEYGFSAVVAGFRWDYGGWTTKEAHDWWTSTDGTSSRKVTRNLNSTENDDKPGVMGTHYDLWDYGFYIRCLQDEAVQETKSSSSIEIIESSSSETVSMNDAELLYLTYFDNIVDDVDVPFYKSSDILETINNCTNMNYYDIDEGGSSGTLPSSYNDINSIGPVYRSESNWKVKFGNYLPEIYTAAQWVKSDSYWNGYNMSFVRGDALPSPGRIILVGFPTDDGAYFDMDNSEVFNSGAISGSDFNLSTPRKEGWHHYAIVVNNKELWLKAYRDGKIVVNAKLLRPWIFFLEDPLFYGSADAETPRMTELAIYGGDNSNGETYPVPAAPLKTLLK